jgi:3-mercaptopyruvate sulfurtransferase SseA
MRLKFMYSAMIVAAAVVLASCNAIDTTVKSNSQNSSNNGVGQATPYPDGASRVSTAELESLIKKGKAYIVDVRSQDSWDMGHIPGARLIPAGEILNHVNELPNDKVIVTYCS